MHVREIQTAQNGSKKFDLSGLAARLFCPRRRRGNGGSPFFWRTDGEVPGAWAAGAGDHPQRLRAPGAVFEVLRVREMQLAAGWLVGLTVCSVPLFGLIAAWGGLTVAVLVSVLTSQKGLLGLPGLSLRRAAPGGLLPIGVGGSRHVGGGRGKADSPGRRFSFCCCWGPPGRSLRCM